MRQAESFFIPTPIGELQIFCSENKVLEVNLGVDDKKCPQSLAKSSITPSDFAKSVKNQLDGYFNNPNVKFDIDVDVVGTSFQKSVWKVISTIKKGETLTYTDVANQLDSSPRAVGNACRANPVPIIVPCHRVVAKAGLGGFAGQSTGFNIDMKTWLRKHEQVALD